MRLPAVDDVDLFHTGSQRFCRRFDFRNHTAVDRTIGDQFPALCGRQISDQCRRIVPITEDARDITQVIDAQIGL